MVFANNLLAGAAGLGGAGYTPAGAIWLDGAADYLERTPGSASNRQVYTVSFWAKPSTASPTGGNNYVFDVGALASNSEGVRYTGNGEGSLYIQCNNGQEFLNTGDAGRFRDFSAWHHVVWSRNTGNPDGDKSKLYVNGVRITDFDSSFGTRAQNNTSDGNINNTVPHRIGRNVYDGAVWYNGYLAEFILIDGTEYTPNDFGEFDANGNWIPKDPKGLTFGTNGFWLNFADSADLGNDVSGNGNDFTPTSMSAANSTSDRPADDAANDLGNYATLNPLTLQSNMTLANGNSFLDASSGDNGCLATLGFSTGKFYWETSIHSGSAGTGVYHVDRGTNFLGKDLKLASDMGNSISTVRRSMCATTSTTNLARYYYNADGASGTIATIDPANDRICCAVDADAQAMWIGHYDATDGVTDWLDVSGGLTGNPSTGANPTHNAGSTGFPSGHQVPLFHTDSNGLTVYFNHADCLGTIPTGFKALNTANLSAPTVTDPSAYFQTLLYTGTGAELAVTGFTDAAGNNITPDFVWVKDRDFNTNHQLVDAVRGATYELNSNATNTESTAAQGVKSFNSGGFTLGTDGGYNDPGTKYAAWCWKAGNGITASGTTNRSKAYSRSTNTTAGFSIISYEGSSSSGFQTIPHGLGVAPKMGIFKNRDATSAWAVYHTSCDIAANKVVYLNTTAAEAVDGTAFNATWESTNVYVNSSVDTNNEGANYIGYIWAEVAGYSKFGKYTGNGSTDGPFVYCGFRPAWLMIKRIDSADGWNLHDAARDPYNVSDTVLQPNDFSAEGTLAAFDFDANSFTLRTSNAGYNASGGTYIFAAFAEYPVGGDGVAQAKAR